MRTTLDIAEDVLLAVRDRARRERRTIGEVLSDLARRALTTTASSQDQDPEIFFGFAPLPHRGPAVSNELIDRLRDEEGD